MPVTAVILPSARGAGSSRRASGRATLGPALRQEPEQQDRADAPSTVDDRADGDARPGEDGPDRQPLERPDDEPGDQRGEDGAEQEAEEPGAGTLAEARSEEHTSELQSRRDLVCRLLL